MGSTYSSVNIITTATVSFSHLSEEVEHIWGGWETLLFGCLDENLERAITHTLSVCCFTCAKGQSEGNTSIDRSHNSTVKCLALCLPPFTRNPSFFISFVAGGEIEE